MFLYWSRLIESVDYGRIFSWCHHNGRRLIPELHRTCKGILWKGGDAMSIIDFIAVVSFGLACFGLGYTLGKDTINAKK